MMKNISAPPEIGQPAGVGQGTWVQTERKAHEAWARLIARKPRAAELLHLLVANMGRQNAVVVSQKTLAKLMTVTDRTVRTAITDLVAEKWIQVVKMNGPGTVSAYVVNDRVAFGERRENLRFSLFSATVMADAEDQDTPTLDSTELRRIPVLYAGERQLPTGPGEDPPAQPTLDGMEPDLPGLSDPWASQRAEFAARDAAGLPRVIPIPENETEDLPGKMQDSGP